jgi:hypothetical protein
MAAVSGTYTMAHPDATVRADGRPRLRNLTAAAGRRLLDEVIADRAHLAGAAGLSPSPGVASAAPPRT